nr:MAG TPA: Scaffold protein [Microviridae sp.]
MRFRTYYDYRVPHAGIEFTEPSRTKQSELADCDINNIMARYAATGVISHLAAGQPLYGDFSEVEDYQASLNKVMSAEEKFMSLPSELRKKFDFDPQKMIDFILNPDNKEECVKYGFLRDIPRNNPTPSVSVPDSSIDGQQPPAGQGQKTE